MSGAEPPWWETKRRGEVVPLAFVRIDHAGSADEWDNLPQTDSTRRRARYRGSIEDLARRTGAAQPLRFQGDGVTLFYTDGHDGKIAPVRAFEAARALWERMTVDLNVPTRIAVHAAHVGWHPDTGKLEHPAIDAVSHLEQSAPAGAVALSERVYLALPTTVRDQTDSLGVTERDGIPAWVYPASRAEERHPGASVVDQDLDLWTAFRAYAHSAEVRRLRYVGFRLARKEPPSLDVRDVFVPVELRARRFPKLNEPALHQLQHEYLGKEAPPWDRPMDKVIPATSIGKVLGQHRSAVVLGDPGAGKTTLLRWLAVVVADGTEAAERELGIGERLVPILASLGRLAELRRAGGELSVVTALAQYFHDVAVGEPSRIEEFLLARLDAGSCLVLLDGLDEVRSDERAPLRGWLEAFFVRFRKNRFVVTSRVMGFPGIKVPDSEEVVVLPWGEEQMARYIWAFHRGYRTWETGADDDGSSEKKAEELISTLRSSPKLLALARNPFLASALVLIQRAEGRLPRHRIQVYELFARTLCETWSHARRLVAGHGEPDVLYEEEALPLLGHLALHLHEEYPSGTAPEAFVIETLAGALIQSKEAEPEAARQAAREFLDRAAERVQILYERGPGQWSFFHLTFQEFFAAAGLHTADGFEEVALAHLFEPRWLEVIRLGVGYYVLVQKRPRAAFRFIGQVRLAQLKGDLAWVTDVLRKQIPLTSLFVAEAGDAVPRPFQEQTAVDFSRWRYFFPLEIWEALFQELMLTDFGKTLAKHVDDAYLCQTFNDIVQNLGFYDFDSIEEFLDLQSLNEEVGSESLREYLDSDLIGLIGEEVLPALTEILLTRKIPNWYAVSLLADIDGEKAIGILLEIVRREVDLDLETTRLGAWTMAALWRISEGL